MTSRYLACSFLLAACAVGWGDVVAHESTGTYGSLEYAAVLLWNEGSYVVDITAPLEEGEKNLTKARFQAEREVGDGLAAVLVQSLVDLSLSSRETVGSRLRDRPSLLADFRVVAAGAVKTRSHLNEELTALVVRYTIPFFGDRSIMGILTSHERSTPVRKYLPFAPSRDYTGLLIHAQGEYPAWGEPGVSRSVVPCLFLRIYDGDMRLVIDAAGMDPSAVVKRGAVAYVNSTESVEALLRAGAEPLRVMARGVFGISPTDLIIPTETARALLSREHNRELLRTGSIVIVVDAPSSN